MSILDTRCGLFRNIPFRFDIENGEKLTLIVGYATSYATPQIKMKV